MRRLFGGSSIVHDALAVYPLWDEDSSTTVIDHYGGNNGTASVNTDTTFTVGTLGAAMAFTTNTVTLPVSLANRISGGQAFSAAVWVNISSLASGRRLLGNTDSTRGWYLKVKPTGKAEFGLMDTTKSRIITSTTSLVTGTWYCLICTFDGATSLKLYVAGTSEGSVVATGIWPTTLTDNLFITGYGSNEHVMFWGHALSQNEVNTYAAGIRWNAGVRNLFDNHPTLWVGLRNSWPCNDDPMSNDTRTNQSVNLVANRPIRASDGGSIQDFRGILDGRPCLMRPTPTMDVVLPALQSFPEADCQPTTTKWFAQGKPFTASLRLWTPDYTPSQKPIIFGNAPNHTNSYGTTALGGWAICICDSTFKIGLLNVNNALKGGYYNYYRNIWDSGITLDPETEYHFIMEYTGGDPNLSASWNLWINNVKVAAWTQRGPGGVDNFTPAHTRVGFLTHTAADIDATTMSGYGSDFNMWSRLLGQAERDYHFIHQSAVPTNWRPWLGHPTLHQSLIAAYPSTPDIEFYVLWWATMSGDLAKWQNAVDKERPLIINSTQLGYLSRKDYFYRSVSTTARQRAGFYCHGDYIGSATWESVAGEVFSSAKEFSVALTIRLRDWTNEQSIMGNNRGGKGLRLWYDSGKLYFRCSTDASNYEQIAIAVTPTDALLYIVVSYDGMPHLYINTLDATEATTVGTLGDMKNRALWFAAHDTSGNYTMDGELYESYIFTSALTEDECLALQNEFYDGIIYQGYGNGSSGDPVDYRQARIGHYHMLDNRSDHRIFDMSDNRRHGTLVGAHTADLFTYVADWHFPPADDYWCLHFDNSVDPIHIVVPLEETAGQYFEISKSFTIAALVYDNRSPQTGNKVICGSSYDGSVPGWYLGMIDDRMTFCMWTDASNWKRWTVVDNLTRNFNLPQLGYTTVFHYNHVTGEVWFTVQEDVGLPYPYRNSYVVPAAGDALVAVTSAGTVTTIANKDHYIGWAPGAAQANRFQGDVMSCVYSAGAQSYYDWSGCLTWSLTY